MGATALRGGLGIGLLVLAGVVIAATPAVALDPNTLPTGGQVVGGSATIQKTAPARLDVTQHTDRAIINWKSFDIGSAAETDFHQPSSGSIAVNRINNGSPTQILGKLKANGRVMVLNPNGVLFGQGSRVDVAGLIASTGNIDDTKFMRGDKHLTLTGPASGGAVINQGDITVRQGGLAAFVAPSVRNSGTIEARLGRVELAGASKVTLDLYGDGLVEIAVDGKSKAGGTLVANAGKIIADGGRVDISAAAARDVTDNIINMSGVVQAHGVEVKGGTIVLKGSGGGTEVSGTLDASASEAGGTGGTVKVLGDSVTLADGTHIDVSGDSGGGTVLVGGSYQGKGPEPNANTATVAANVRIDADAVTSGNGGTIVTWADGTTRFDGTASAKGGAAGGDGGLVETSGKASLKVGDSAKVDTSAAAGKTGNWLLDPASLTVAETGADITPATVVSNLATTNYTLQADNSITVADAIDSSSQTNSNQLQFQDGNADNNLTVTLNAPITLGGNQTLTGDASTVNVGANGRIQNGVDVGAANSTVNVAAGTYDEQVTLDKAGMTLAGASGAKLAVPDEAQVNGIDITANDVTVSGLEIAGPVSSSYLTYGWGSNISRGIAVHNGITGFTLTGNDIHDVRNGILIDGRNSTGSVTGNRIENTKSGISVQYTDASGITISGNTEGSVGNEWGLNLHLNGHYDGSTVISNSTPIAAAPDASWQQALLDFSTANDGWSVQDQAYTSSNRTQVDVATTGAASNQGSALTPLDTIQNGVDAVVAGGTVNVAAGTYTDQVDVAKEGVSLLGASGAKIAVANQTDGMFIDADNVTVKGFEFYGPLYDPSTDASTSYITYDWGSNWSRGISIPKNFHGFTIENNNFHGLFNAVLVNYSGHANSASKIGSTGTISNNTFDNTRGAVYVQYADQTGLDISGNTQGSIGNEFGTVLHLNGHFDTTGTDIRLQTAIADAPDTAQQQALLDLSQANNDWSVMDQGYKLANRTQAEVTTTGGTDQYWLDAQQAHQSTPAVQGTPITPLGTIQQGIDAIVPGGTVNVAAGTYDESLSIGKALTLSGAGAGSSIIEPASGNGVTVSGNIGSGADVTLKGFTFQNAPNSGVDVAADATLGLLTIQNSAFDSNGYFGFRLDGNSTTGSNVAKVELLDSAFHANGSNYTEATSLGRGDINFNYYNGDATLKNVNVVGYDAGGGANVGIQFRGTTNNISDAGTIAFDNVSVTGSYRRPDNTYVSGSTTKNYGTWNPGGPGDAMHILEYDSVAGISFNDVTLDPTLGHGLFAEGLSTTLDVGNTTFGQPNTTITGSVTPTLSQNIVSGQNDANDVRTNIDATAATFTGADKSTLAGSFAIEDRVAHRTDRADLGLVTWNPDNIYVTANSGSIQRGVDAASTGDTIHVQAGTYDAFTANKDGITLLGDVASAGQGADAPKIDPSTCYSQSMAACAGVLVNANNVTLSGFNISNTNGPYGVEVGTIPEYGGQAADGTTLTYNWIHDVNGESSGDGIRVVDVEPGSNITIAHNLIGDSTPTNSAAASYGKTIAGVFLRSAGGAFSNVSVADNVIQNISLPNAASNQGAKGIWLGSSSHNYDVAGLSITGNQISNVTSNLGAEGLLVNNGRNASGTTTDLSIADNTITGVSGGSWSHGIDLEGPTPDASVTGNAVDLTGSTAADTAAVYVDSNSNADTGAASIAATGNKFVVPTSTYGVAVAGSATVNASANWWGTTSESGVLAKTYGSVDVSPYLMSGTDTDSSAAGFQGDTSNLTVTALGAQSGSTGRIQEGIDRVDAGGTVNVAAGTYAGGITIGKQVSLVGAGAANTKITSGTTQSLVTLSNTLVSFDRSAFGDGITVDGGSNVSLSGFSLTGFEYALSAYGTADNLHLDNLTLDNNFSALWVGDRQNAVTTNADGFQMTNSTIQNGVYGVYTQAWLSGSNTPRTSFANALFQNDTVDGLTAKGFYIEAARNLKLDTVTVANSGNFGTQLSNTPNARKYGAGIDINLKYDDFGTLAFNNVNVTNSGNSSGDRVTGAGMVIKTRGGAGDSSSYTPRPASLTSVSFTGGSIKGSPGDALRVENLRTPSGGQPSVALNGTKFQSNGIDIRVGTTSVDASKALFLDATNTREFANLIYDRADNPSLGLVTGPTLPVPVDTLPPAVTKATPPPPAPPPPPPPPPAPQQVVNTVPAPVLLNLMSTAAGGPGGGGSPQQIVVTNNTANVGNILGSGNIAVLDLSTGLGSFSSTASLTPPAPPTPATPAAPATTPAEPPLAPLAPLGGVGPTPGGPAAGGATTGGTTTGGTTTGGTTTGGSTGPTTGETQQGPGSQDQNQQDQQNQQNQQNQGQQTQGQQSQ